VGACQPVAANVKAIVHTTIPEGRSLFVMLKGARCQSHRLPKQSAWGASKTLHADGVIPAVVRVSTTGQVFGFNSRATGSTPEGINHV